MNLRSSICSIFFLILYLKCGISVKARVWTKSFVHLLMSWVILEGLVVFLQCPAEIDAPTQRLEFIAIGKKLPRYFIHCHAHNCLH